MNYTLRGVVLRLTFVGNERANAYTQKKHQKFVLLTSHLHIIVAQKSVITCSLSFFSFWSLDDYIVSLLSSSLILHVFVSLSGAQGRSDVLKLHIHIRYVAVEQVHVNVQTLPCWVEALTESNSAE